MSAGYGDEGVTLQGGFYDSPEQAATALTHGVTQVEVTLKGGSAGTADGPGEPGSVTIRPATVVNGGQEVNLRDMITSAPQQQLADRLTAVLGRKYLAHQLASALPPDVCMRLADRVEELTGPEVERRVAEQIDQIHADVNEATAQTLARLAAAADQKRRELTRERFHPSGSRLS